MKNPPCPDFGKKRLQYEEDAIRLAIRSSMTYGKPMRNYRCTCGGWHVTSKVRPIRAPKTTPGGNP